MPLVEIGTLRVVRRLCQWQLLASGVNLDSIGRTTQIDANQHVQHCDQGDWYKEEGDGGGLEAVLEHHLLDATLSRYVL